MRRRSNSMPNQQGNQPQPATQSPAMKQIDQQQKQLNEKRLREQEKQIREQRQKNQQPQTNTPPAQPTMTTTANKDELSGKPYLLVSKLGNFADALGEHIEDVLFSLDNKMASHSGYLGMKGNSDDLRDPVRFYAEDDRSLHAVAENLNTVLRRDAQIKDLVQVKHVTQRKASRINKLVRRKMAGPGFQYDEDVQKAQQNAPQLRQQMQPQQAQQPQDIGLKLLVNGKPVDHVPDEMHLRERYQQMGGIVLLQLLLRDEKKADLAIDLDEKTAVWTENFWPQVMSISRGLGMLRRAIEKVKADVSRARLASTNETMQVELTYTDDFGNARGFNVEVKAHNDRDAILKARKLVQEHVDRDIFQTFRGERARTVKASRQEIGKLVNAFRVLFADQRSDVNRWMKGELSKRNIPFDLETDWYSIIEFAAKRVSNNNPETIQDVISEIIVKLVSQNSKGDDIFSLYDQRKMRFKSFFWRKVQNWSTDISRGKIVTNERGMFEDLASDYTDEGNTGDPLEQIADSGALTFEQALEEGSTISGIRKQLKQVDPDGRLVTIFDELMKKTTLANIAKMVGLSGPSHVSHYLKKIRSVIFDYLQSAEPDSAAFNAIQQALSKKVVTK